MKPKPPGLSRAQQAINVIDGRLTVFRQELRDPQYSDRKKDVLMRVIDTMLVDRFVQMQIVKDEAACAQLEEYL